MLRGFADWLTEFAVWFFWECLYWVFYVLWNLIEPVWEELLAGVKAVAGSLPTIPPELLEALRLANYYAPIDAGFLMVATYWTFLAVFVAAKFILKLIPAIG